jgi:hypothetical protein
MVLCQYRLLTGEALKMIKEGVDKAIIADKLYILYIDPVLQQPVNYKDLQLASSTMVISFNLVFSSFISL